MTNSMLCIAAIVRWMRRSAFRNFAGLLLSLPALAPAQPVIALQLLAPGTWCVAGAAGDANEANRGAISNLLIVADGPRTWALGSGPSPVYGQALAEAVTRTTGRSITDVIAPWSRPELVLGSSGMARVQVWSHREVTQQMRERCTRCVERLAARLGGAASDLGTHPVRLADHEFFGGSGRLGPWRWWRLDRSTAASGDHTTPQVVTLWWLARAGLWFAPGLIWTDGAPDLRDSSVPDLIAATQRLQALQEEVAAATQGRTHMSKPPGTRWLPEQGAPAPTNIVARHLHYWTALQAAADQAWQDGASETDAAPPLAGVDPDWLLSPRHALNWQRAWREAEARALAAPAPAWAAHPASAPP
jgi:hypothetical protein